MITERRTIQDDDSYFNAQFDAVPVYLQPGQSLSGQRDDQMIVARVGAGVIVSIYDTVQHAGAAAYILVPPPVIAKFPYFDQVDPALLKKTTKPIDDIVEALEDQGAEKSHLYVRLMGGARLPDDQDDHGTKNYIFVREYVTRHGLAVRNEDLGGRYVRRVHYFPASGRAVRLLLRRNSDFDDMRKIESAYRG